MFFTNGKKTHAVTMFTADDIRTLVSTKAHAGVNIDYAHKSSCSESLMKDFFITKPEALSKILKTHYKGLIDKKIHLLLPHHVFDYVNISLLRSGNFKQDIHDIKARMEKEIKERKDSVMVYQYNPDQKESISRTLVFLSKERFDAFEHLIRKSGKKLASIKPEVYTVMSLYDDYTDLLWAHVNHKSSHLFAFKDGIFSSHKLFDFSYHSLAQEYVSREGDSFEDAHEKISKDGVLQRVKNQAVQKALFLQLKPLLLALKTHKKSPRTQIFVSYDAYVIPGLVDSIKKNIHKKADLFDVYELGQDLDEVLTVPRRELPGFQFLLADALNTFTE